MKTTSTLLLDFIQDFDIESYEGGACFNAIVDFSISGQIFRFESNVLMEAFLFNGIDTLYLLNPITRTYMLPSCFNEVNHQFIYFKNRGLFIEGYMAKYGSYSLSIFPDSITCTPKTYEELRVKKLN